MEARYIPFQHKFRPERTLVVNLLHGCGAGRCRILGAEFTTVVLLANLVQLFLQLLDFYRGKLWRPVSKSGMRQA